MTQFTILVAAVALVVSAVSPVLWLPLLRRRGVVDIPSQRSSHTGTALRGAGLAPACATALALVAVLLSRPPSAAMIAAVVALALLAAGVGLAEDLIGLSVGVRLSGQLLLGATFAGALCVVTGAPWWVAPMVAAAVTCYINMANFMDGVDGMSVLHGLVAGGYYTVVGMLLDRTGIAACGALTAAAFIGFAPWNLIRKRTFLGDVGSYLLGALVIGCGAAVFAVDRAPLLALGPALPYVADTTSTLLRRALRGEPVTQPHRTHVYQRLTDLGLSHRACAAIVAAASLLCSAAALVSRAGGWQAAAAAGFAVLVIGCYLTTPRALTYKSPRVRAS